MRTLRTIDSYPPPPSAPHAIHATTLMHDATRTHLDLRWTSAVALCATLGLACVGVADAASLKGYGYTTASVFFWLGLLLIFVPVAFRALMSDTVRRERLTLIILLGVALYLVKVLGSPDSFTFGDEYIHMRNMQDILRTQHLFASNPILPTAAYYPGLGALTVALVDLTGLSPFAAGIVIIGIARVLLSACFFLIAERVTESDRAAAGASLIYAANPMFLFWSAAFSYENLALPLAAFIVWWIGRTRREPGRWAPLATAMAIGAVIVTHHIAGLAVSALLCAWWLAERFTQPPSAARRALGLTALAAGTGTLVWLFFIARPAASYLFSDNLFPALRQTGAVLLGNASPRRLYSSGGYVPPAWETVAGFTAVGVLLLVLSVALYFAWKRSIRAPMAAALGVALLYPLSLIPRLTYSGVAISGRSSEYVFAGLGCVLGLLIAGEASRPRGRRQGAAQAWYSGLRWTAVATGLLTLVFIGEITVGTAFYQRLPEPSHAQGYPWSVQLDVISAAKWSRANLGIRQRFGANQIDSFALAVYGEQTMVPEDSVWPIFFANEIDDSVVKSIKAARVRYLLVDWRMTQGVPATPGYYFSPQEPGAGEYKQAFRAAALEKFSTADCIRLVYDSGPIQIFDVSRIEDGSCVPLSSPSPKTNGAPR